MSNNQSKTQTKLNHSSPLACNVCGQQSSFILMPNAGNHFQGYTPVCNACGSEQIIYPSAIDSAKKLNLVPDNWDLKYGIYCKVCVNTNECNSCYGYSPTNYTKKRRKRQSDLEF
jgi:hypothetical protein